MQTNRIKRLLLAATFAIVGLPLLGCEGINRKHDARVADLQLPPENASAEPSQLANFPDLVEEMMATRQTYIGQLINLERAYLMAGDDVKSNWARRQRELVEGIEAYPYLDVAAPEQRSEVAPEERIADADAIFDQAFGLLNEVRGVPLAGHLKHNKDKARKALALFKQVLRDYPRSDKVDDSAFFCGEIYKEYLREDDPDDELALRYYRWAVALDPETPHAARFQAAVVYDFRRHDRTRALELYHQVLETEEDANDSNMRFAATRIEQLTDEDQSHLRPNEPTRAPGPQTVLSEPKDTGEPEPEPKPTP